MGIPKKQNEDKMVKWRAMGTTCGDEFEENYVFLLLNVGHCCNFRYN